MRVQQDVLIPLDRAPVRRLSAAQVLETLRPEWTDGTVEGSRALVEQAVDESRARLADLNKLRRAALAEIDPELLEVTRALNDAERAAGRLRRVG